LVFAAGGRSSTLVAGANCCDFRFHALPASGEQALANALPMVGQ
jgi:hypothetical protein